MKKLFILILSAIVYGLFSMVITQAYAKDKDLVLLYTGETHSMLYHCNCPLEPDGGVARRASLIKQLKKQYPDSLVLDSGNFFSGGLLDQNTQDPQLDMQRAAINLAALQLMKYDALCLSDDEFNFGTDFLKKNMAKVKLDFISSNLSSDLAKPYIIKKVAGIKIGIIGLTNLAAKQKAQDLKFIEPKQAVEKYVQELKKKGIGLIILLSNLGESEDTKIIKSVAGISVVIDGHGRGNTVNESSAKVGSTVVLRPNWQGRRLGKAVLSIKGDKIEKVSVEELRLSDKISDDPGILSILPRCFSDNDCKKEGLVGNCRNAGNINASCLFSEAAKINLTVISSKECSICNPEPLVNSLKKQFPGLVVTYLDYSDKQAAKVVRDLKLSGLPAYLFSKELAKDKNFDNLKAGLEEKDNFYILKPEASGLSYFPGRQKAKGRVDLFISLFDQESLGVLNVMKEFNPIVHFLAVVQDDKIGSSAGVRESEEDLRALCVQKYYPQAFWNYITCRAKNINSTWWDDCAANMDANKIKTCSRGPEGKSLLKENTGLNSELKIMFGPTYLLDNNQIFSSKGAPSKEELKKIIKK
ncbi:MAG: hypothetical protein Q7K98_01880 [Candidatus Omnitrophota bacterium]|nr:hypothetical protein [Candidatus Omnitrophota bacterium]